MSFFFFQAEDGIRDLVRSRGLGDVYKRQLLGQVAGQLLELAVVPVDPAVLGLGVAQGVGRLPVSYTHLTLPTIYSV